jgi:hypothetical protein
MSNRTFSSVQVHGFIGSVFAEGLHAKRILSLGNATLGVLNTASLAVNTIGRGLALATGGVPKHATKQVDRLLSNEGLDVDALHALWVPFAAGARTQIYVAMDWTDFDADGHATIMLSLLSRHGRATPLVWRSVEKASLRNKRGSYEKSVLRRLAEVLPEGVRVCIVADRGFADKKLYRVLTEELRFDYVIRFRGDILVTDATGQTRPATEWISKNGHARLLRGARVTADAYQVGTVVCVRDPAMKQPWCLAASTSEATARELINLYGRRWGIECGFRDAKNPRFGMGMGSVRVSTPARRDRLWLIAALAIALLTLLGAAGEAIGYDRHLKTNTAKRRTISLFRQGCMLYELMLTMPEQRLLPLLERFTAELEQIPLFKAVFGTI